MNIEKIPQQLYNLLENAYRTFYHIVFLEVSKSYGIIPNGLKIKKAACIGNVSENFVTSWNLELTKAEVQLMEVLILEHVRKLYAIEESFNLCLSITRYRKTGFFEQEIIRKSSKKKNVRENSRSSVNFQIMKLFILNVWIVLKATLNFFLLSLTF